MTEQNDDLRIFLKFNQEKKDIFVDKSFKGHDLKDHIKDNFKINDFHLCTSRGVDLKSDYKICDGEIFCVYPKIIGGKGGFGSLLRAFGKQITKSTNRDACRDLSGRRIRTVNRDKRMKEFLEKQAEKAQEKEEAKKEKREKRKAELEKKHIFSDPKYEQQKQKISKDLDEALNVVLENGDVDRKRKIETTDTILAVAEKPKNGPQTSSSGTAERFKDWMGVEISDSEEEEEEPIQKKCKTTSL